MNFRKARAVTKRSFQLGRGYFLEENFTAAIEWYNRVHDEFPKADEGEQGFYYVGHCYQYLGDANRAIARYEAFLKAYPRSEYIGTAHLNAIDTLRAAGRLDEALKWAARAQSNVSDPFIKRHGALSSGADSSGAGELRGGGWRISMRCARAT